MHPSTNPPRIAFVGQATFFEACMLEGPNTAFVEFRMDADPHRLVKRLRELDPDVVVVFKPEVVPAGVLAEVRGLTLGFLTEPLPRVGLGAIDHEDLDRRLWEFSQIDPAGFDRVVTFDPKIVETASGILSVWRSTPLPVADRYYRPVGAPISGASKPLFVGRSTPHRERMLMEAKHHHDVVHYGFGVDAARLEELLDAADVGINLHNQPYPSFENRVCIHLAAGHLVLSEPLDPLHGLEPGIDHVVVMHPGEVQHALWCLRRYPGMWHSVRVRGRRKAELYRASRVWPRLVGDLARDVAAFGSARGGSDRGAEALKLGAALHR